MGLSSYQFSYPYDHGRPQSMNECSSFTLKYSQNTNNEAETEINYFLKMINRKYTKQSNHYTICKPILCILSVISKKDQIAKKRSLTRGF